MANITGTSSDDTLTGTAGDDTITGLAGNDTISGEAGNDLIDTGPGVNDVSGGAGDDTILLVNTEGEVDGGDGIDVLSFENATFPGAFGVDVDLEDGEASARFGGPETVSVTGVENVIGTAQRDNIRGDAGDNTLNGGADVDTISGGGGDDLILGGDGGDTLRGGTGTDTILGGAGSDRIISQLGTSGRLEGDEIIGGEGDPADIDNLVYAGPRSVEINISGAESGTTVYQGSQQETFSEIEFLQLGNGSDTLNINVDPAEDVLTVQLGSGSDIVNAGNLNIDIEAGVGEDLLNFSAISDDLSIDLGSGVVSQDTSTSTTTGNATSFTRVDSGSGDDVIVGRDISSILATNRDQLNGGAGNDSIEGLAGDDTLLGGAGDDTLEGGDGNDTINGDDGDDSIDGGAGNDTIDGGAGTDTIVGGAGDDLLIGRLDGDTYRGGISGSVSNSGSDTLDFSGYSSGLFLDRNLGQFGDVRDGAGNDASYTLIDTLILSEFADTAFVADALTNPRTSRIEMGGGDDTVEVSSANVDLDGGTGVDDLTVDRISDDLVVDLTAGTISQTSGGTAVTGTVTNFENVTTDEGNDTLTGNANANVLDGGAGNDALLGLDGNDSLIGGAGDDTLSGGAGNDTLSGGSGGDTFIAGSGDDAYVGGAGTNEVNVLDYSAIGAGVNVVGDIGRDGTVVGSVSGTDTFSDIRQFTLTGFDDSFTAVTGSIPFSRLYTVDLGAGDDSATVSDVKHFLNGGVGNDTVDFSDVDGVTFDLRTGSLIGRLSSGTALNFENVIGSTGAANDITGTSDANSISGGLRSDTIAGGDGNDTILGLEGDDSLVGGFGDDEIDGGEGADLIEGGPGNDTLRGGDGTDSIAAGRGDDFVDGGAGADTINGWIGDDFIVGDTLTSSLGNENDSIFGAVGEDTIFGGFGDDTLSGGDDADSIEGGAGDDQILGGAGNDTLIGDDGDDVLDGGAGDDNLQGGTGFDTAIYSNAGSAIQVDLTTETASGGGGNDTLIGIDGVEGSAFDDSIVGDVTNNVLNGGAGNDSIDGGAGDDTLNGGDGADVITFGRGTDIASGGTGADTFVLVDGVNANSISDFLLGEDVLDVTGLESAFAKFAGQPVRPGEVNVTNNPGDTVFPAGSQTLTFPDGTTLLVSAGTIRTGDAENQINDLVEAGVVCFTRGTNIHTLRGIVPVQELRVGDKVQTVDQGIKPITWIGSRKVRAWWHTAPIKFATGSFGNTQTIVVSPQHRMLLRGPEIELMFGEHEVFAAAKDLVDGVGITRQAGNLVEYWHIMFENHQVIFANGYQTESFYPGRQAIAALEVPARQRLFEAEPNLESQPDLIAYGHLARRELSSRESRALGRHRKDDRRIQANDRRFGLGLTA